MNTGGPDAHPVFGERTRITTKLRVYNIMACDYEGTCHGEPLLHQG